MLKEAGVGYALAVPKLQQAKSLAGIWYIDALIAEDPDACSTCHAAKAREASRL
jgi:hypothetical protein